MGKVSQTDVDRGPASVITSPFWIGPVLVWAVPSPRGAYLPQTKFQASQIEI